MARSPWTGMNFKRGAGIFPGLFADGYGEDIPLRHPRERKLILREEECGLHAGREIREDRSGGSV
jgi:hypothetical protein